jgi:hypothetical protein
MNTTADQLRDATNMIPSQTCAACQHSYRESDGWRCFWALSPATHLPEWHWLQAPSVIPTGGEACRAYLARTEDET